MTTTVASSTTAPASTSSPKLRVRRRGKILTAHKLTERKTITLPNGFPTQGYPGDYAITSEGHIVDLVTTLTDYEIVQEGLFLPDHVRAEVERVLGVGAMKSPKDLVHAAERLAKLEIGQLRVDFSPGQWEELSRKAVVQSQSVEEYLARLVKKFTADIWGL